MFRVAVMEHPVFCQLSGIKGKKITSKPHHENRRAFKAPRKEFFVAPLLRRRIRRKRVFLGVLFNPFLSETRFSRRSRGERNHHHSKVCVLLCFENSKRKHSSRRRRETPRCSAVVVVHRRHRKRRESSEREREKVDEALFDFKRSSSIECLV